MRRRGFLALLGGCAWAATGRPWAAAPPCRPTADNIEGPFYLPGAPFARELAHPEEPGTPLSVAGRVLAAGGCSPVPGAVVDVWHANADGVYYGVEGGGVEEPYGLRGRIRVAEDGRYHFRTVLPGRYRLSRTRYRPRHIHYRVGAPGYVTLVTQLYFTGDPYLSGDPFARPSLAVPLEPAEGGQRASFDVVLAPA